MDTYFLAKLHNQEDWLNHVKPSDQVIIGDGYFWF